MEEHYLKTINTLMNKYVAVSKELKTFHSTREQNMINDDQKCVKSQKKAMTVAQINEKTQFAQRIKTEFLKGKWSKEFVKEFQDPTNFKKLWWGETNYISLGTVSMTMTALKVTRNAMAKRVVYTTARFIDNNLKHGKRGNEILIMKDIDEAMKFGRTSETSYKNCLVLFGSFGTKKGLSSTLLQRTQNNLSGKNYKHAVQTVHKELEGHLLEDKILSARMAFIYLQIQNNLIVPSAELHSKHGTQMVFKPKTNLLKFTSPVHRRVPAPDGTN
eukprot:scaffold36894_cov64-Attheya_sp.AAC.1